MITIDEIFLEVDKRETSMIYSAWRIEKQKLTEFLFGPGKYAIEIGSFKGGTSRVLAVACRLLGKKLVCVDPWEGQTDQENYIEYLSVIEDVKESVITIRAKSSDALQFLPIDLPGNLCLLFVDGDHTYPEPLKDMISYWPLLATGGVMALHDIFDVRWHSDIFRAVNQFFRDKSGYCLEAINYIPDPSQVTAAEHRSSGLIWTTKQECEVR